MTSNSRGGMQTSNMDVNKLPQTVVSLAGVDKKERTRGMLLDVHILFKMELTMCTAEHIECTMYCHQRYHKYSNTFATPSRMLSSRDPHNLQNRAKMGRPHWTFGAIDSGIRPQVWRYGLSRSEMIIDCRCQCFNRLPSPCVGVVGWVEWRD